jgi:adenylate kinase
MITSNSRNNDHKKQSLLVLLAGDDAINELKRMCGPWLIDRATYIVHQRSDNDSSRSLRSQYSTSTSRPVDLPHYITGFYCSENECTLNNHLEYFFHLQLSHIQVNQKSSNFFRTNHRVKRNFIIIGPPASGKGTACALLTSAFPGLVHISSGALLREEIAANESNPNSTRNNKLSLGQLAQRYTSKGQLVPDEIITKLVIKRILKDDCKNNGFLLDGYPRNSAQCHSLIEATEIHSHTKIHYVILLHANRASIIDRSDGRRVDPVTGKIYHIQHSPPPTREISERLIQRQDDRKEIVQARWDDYVATLPNILPWFKQILNVDAEHGNQWDVFHRIIESIETVNNEYFAQQRYDWTSGVRPTISQRISKRLNSSL